MARSRALGLLRVRSTTLTITTVTKGGVTVDRPGLNKVPTNAWVVFNGFVPVHRGNTIPTWSQETTRINAVSKCPSIVTSQTVYDACVRKLGLHDVELYLADNEYRALQLREGGPYLASAVLLLGAGLVLVRRQDT